MRKAGSWDGAERRKRERDPADRPGGIDFPIFISVLVLCAIGLVVVFSASYYYAEDRWADGLYYVRKQALYLLIALAAMLLLTRIDYRRLEKLGIPAIIISVALLIAVLAFGTETNSAKRWLIIGPVSIQPSEIAKFGMMLFMCMFMNQRRAVMEDFAHGLVPMLVVIAIICGLVMLQPNMSMAVIIGMMGVILLYVGGARPKYIAIIGIVGVGLFVLLAVVAPYRLLRLTTFRDPWQDPQGSGYQLIQSLYALGSGGLFGQGLNGSRQKMLYMIYGESDFIFAILGEELGFCVAGAILLLYFFIVYRGIRIAMRCRDRFGSLLAAGITTVFGIQVAVNIGVVTGSMPTTGQTLPFISAGGSSLVLFMCAMGVLLNISRHTSEV